MQNEREKFLAMIENLGTLTPSDVLRCIEIAKLAMMNGECSVEAYYFAKNIFLSQLEPASPLIN